MKKGFTIIELLVASALLGMLVTILTMIFNQSSIAWRIGIAGVSDLGDIRYTTGMLRDVADNAFVYSSGQRGVYVSPWDLDGKLHSRACITEQGNVNTGSGDTEAANALSWFFNKVSINATTDEKNSVKKASVGSGDSGGSFNTYSVNVMSGGPANDINDWQAIWSYPDDPSQW